jgi:aldehyde dehydrogenase (NAD+)
MDSIIKNLVAQYNLQKPWVASTGLQSYSSESQDQHTIESPIDNTAITKINYCNVEVYHKVIDTAYLAKSHWANIPAPRRGEIIRKIGNNFRKHKESLAQLITIEMGKTITEARGEVQEVIDICDYAVGLSRQLYGLTMHSERPNHRMYEQYHPLGIVGTISAFNFPVAVWSWNAIIGAACGNVSVWKPSENTPLSAIATQAIVAEVIKDEQLPEGIFNVIIGGREIGELLTDDKRIPLISATGSTEMGKKVAQRVGARLGKTILELGGNNAIIVTQNANLKLALHASIFGVAGTCGQRCTSTRRIIIHESIYEKFKNHFIEKIKDLSIGNPLNESSLIGPLFNINSKEKYINSINEIKKNNHKIVYGGNALNQIGNNYVEPTIVEVDYQSEIVKRETFAPIVYLIKYEGDVREAIALQNDVPQGLSSSIFTTDLTEAEIYLSANGSDCGIANVNIGTSGAEIGGAFGGEKETGGGRESGSDAWKAYMRRQTNTINYSTEISLAQGVKFEIN